MLQFLSIDNLALLKKVELDFLPGFTTVTGETGAGKSVLLGALRLLTGARVDKSIIGQHSDTCQVQAILHFPCTQKINGVLHALDLPACDDETLILKRSISKTKSGKILVNGSVATLSNLQQLSSLWIDFHGTGEPQKLSSTHYQIHLLDAFGGSQPLAHDYSESYGLWQKTLKEIETLQNEEQLSSDDLEYYQKQLDKLTAIEVSEEAIGDLESQFNRLANTQEISSILQDLSNTLAHESAGTIATLQQALRACQGLEELDSQAGDLTARVQSMILEAQDLSQELFSRYQDSDISPSQAAQLEHNMHIWLDLKRQFGPTLENVIQKRDALAHKINIQSDIEGHIIKLEHQAKEQEAALREVGAKLTTHRKKSAKKLEKSVTAILKDLGFKNAQFCIEFDSEKALKAYGDTTPMFTFCPNPGQSTLPLNKIASSGEMARVMLALKSLFAQTDHTPVLVFDEVDANVGGEIATQVAAKLTQLAKEHQVFCITHLPQVASHGDNHLLVEKKQSTDATNVEIRALDSSEAKVEELARMLGDRHSDAALKHARELLSV